ACCRRKEGSGVEEEAEAPVGRFPAKEDQVVLEGTVQDQVGEAHRELRRADRARPELIGEFEEAAFCGYLEQGAEIVKPVTAVMQLVGESDHTWVVALK